jgi:hypothetical protein
MIIVGTTKNSTKTPGSKRWENFNNSDFLTAFKKYFQVKQGSQNVTLPLAMPRKIFQSNLIRKKEKNPPPS